MTRILALVLTAASLALASCQCCKTKKTDACCATDKKGASCCESDVGKLKVGGTAEHTAH